MKMEKETIISHIMSGIIFILMILIAFRLLYVFGEEHNNAVEFCTDKEGLYNISNYGYEFKSFYEILNCSDKENPAQITNMIV